MKDRDANTVTFAEDQCAASITDPTGTRWRQRVEEWLMAKLTAKQRAALKPSQFGLPEKARTKKARKQAGNYPMPDEGHAISAVQLAKKHHKAGKLSKSDYTRIRRKAHKILEKK